MIIYFYLFILLSCRFAESSSIKGRNHKNDLVPFLSSRPDTQKDNSLKIVSNEPFIIQFQMPPQSKENVYNGAKTKDKKKKRPDKKRVSKIKPLRKKIRKRRDVSAAENRKEKRDHSTKRPIEVQTNQENFISRQEMLKALNIHLNKKETKKLKSDGMKNFKEDRFKTDDTSSRNLHRNHSPPLPDHEPHVKMIYPSTPKSDSHNYSYKDLIADRERLEQKINYIRNMLNVNDSTVEDAVRIRRKSDSDNTANKIAKMFLTLSAVNGLHDKQSKCRDDDDDIWEKERKKSTSRQSSSSNEERYKVKKWIEYMKNKRSSSKTCPCMNEYNEENDIFPLEKKLAKGYPFSETGTSSEEATDKYRDPLNHPRGRPNKSGPNRNSYKEDTRSRLRALANRGRRKYELPIDDLELYRSRAKQILQNAEEILDKIKEEEEKRLAAPHALVSRLRELTSRIQEDPRNNENDLIKIIQKNLGWIPQSKSQSGADNNSFVENMKSFILDPYEKAKALTDESTRKLSSYLLRNLGKIDSSEEQEEATEKSPQIFHGQVPQNEEMFSANLAKENPESDLLAKDREEHQNWSDTLSGILGGNEGDLGKEKSEGGELKKMKNMEDSIKRRMEEIIKEQGEKISEYTEKPDDLKIDETTVIDLMTGKQIETSKDDKQPEEAEKVKEMFELEKQGENIEKSEAREINQNGVPENESETVKSTAQETGSEVTASEHQQLSKDQVVSEEFAESVSKNSDTEGEDHEIRPDLLLEPQDVKGAIAEPSPKEAENVAKYPEDNRESEDAKADENQDEDVVMATESESEKGKSNEEQALESPDEQVKSTQDREENDVLNSKYLIQEGEEQSEVENVEESAEDIEKLTDENAGGRPEETVRQDDSEKYEGTVVKKEHDSIETTNPEENVAEFNPSRDSVVLQTETASEETPKELNLGSNTFSTEVVQISQDPKESLQYDDAKNVKSSTEIESSAEGLVESAHPENSAQGFVESKKTEDSAEDIEQTKSIEEETKTELDTLKSQLADEAEKNVEKVRKELDNQNVSEEKEILRESLDDIEQDEKYEEPSLKASLDESDNEQKSSETPLQKSLEEGEENVNLRSEDAENETLESSSREVPLQASKQGQEENEEVDETENDEVSLKASTLKNTDEIRNTSTEENLEIAESELDNRENEDEPHLRAEQTEVEEIEKETEESPLTSENPEKDTEMSNERLMSTFASQEKVEAASDKLREENSEIENQERIDETLKATADEIDELTEEAASAEIEKVEEQHEGTENLEESSREANLNEESVEIKKPPKLLMSIKENFGDEKESMKADEEEGSKEYDSLIGDTLNVSEENDADVESKNVNEENPVGVANSETDQVQSKIVQDTQEMDDEDDVNVRAENVKDLNNQIDDEGLKDGELRSANAESEPLNEDANLKDVDSLEQQELDKDDVVEAVEQIKEPETQQEITVGKTKNLPASGEDRNYEQNQSKNTLKVPKSIGKIMRDLDGKEKDDYTSLTNLNPEKIDHIIDKIDEAEHRNKLESEDVDCRKECACADEINTRSRNIGRYEIVKDFLHWVKDLQLNRVLTDE